MATVSSKTHGKCEAACQRHSDKLGRPFVQYNKVSDVQSRKWQKEHTYICICKCITGKYAE